MLPYEFCAKDDEAGQCSVNEERTGEVTRDPEEEAEALESYPETEQSIVPVVPLSSSPSVFEEVRLADNLLVFRSGQNYIIVHLPA